MAGSSSEKLKKQRQLAVALKRLQKIRRSEDFDPTRPNSRPTEQQMEIINDFGNVHIQ